MAIKSLKGKIANDLWETMQSKKLPREFWKRTRYLMEIMNASSTLQNLKILGHPPDIRLHKLVGDMKNHWSITINRSSGWRIVFQFETGEFINVEIIDYHEG